MMTSKNRNRHQKKNGRQPQKKWRTTSKIWKTTSYRINQSSASKDWLISLLYGKNNVCFVCLYGVPEASRGKQLREVSSKNPVDRNHLLRIEINSFGISVKGT
jgi:hypothetical protein